MYQLEITVTGPEKELKKFKISAEGLEPPRQTYNRLYYPQRTPVFCFHALCPIPDDLLPIRENKQEAVKEWCRKHWGSYPEKTSALVLETNQKLVYRVSCNSFPIGFFQEISGKFAVIFDVAFEESSTLRAGKYTFSNKRKQGTTWLLKACVCGNTPLFCSCHHAVPEAPIPAPVEEKQWGRKMTDL